MSPLRALGARVREDESGFGIIEVLVSAVIVVMISVGALQTIDTANRTSGNSKSRTIAADLAQQDQERMRAFRAEDLAEVLDRESTRVVAGVSYEIVSNAVWVNDGSGSRRCGLTANRADYLQITSTVTWRDMRGADPVTLTSLYAPPSGTFGDQGNLGIEVLGRDGIGVPGVSVAATGTANRSGVTDAQGCIFFAFLPQGDYTMTIGKLGYVDPSGATEVAIPMEVIGGTTQVYPVDYDQAGGLSVTVKSRKGTGTDVNALAAYTTIGHSQLASPSTRLFGNGTTFLGTSPTPGPFPIGGLYPFDSPYSVYTGACAGNSPPTPASALVDPGATTSVTVNEPGLKIRYSYKDKKDTKTADLPQGTGVTLTAKLPCTGTTAHTVDGNAWLSPPGLPASPPADTIDPGVPYGVYDVCANFSGGKKRVFSNFNLDATNGETVTLPEATINGSCP